MEYLKFCDSELVIVFIYIGELIELVVWFFFCLKVLMLLVWFFLNVFGC